MDLFVANAKNAGQDRNNFLYLNLGLQGGVVQFQRITTDVLATDEEDSWGSGWADFDNDGDLDIIVTNQSAPNFLYRNDGDNHFFRIGEGNIGNNGGDSRGTGWSDYTNDGYVDMLLLNLDSAVENPHNLLYENLKPASNKWIKIEAIGTVSNRSAIGAKVHVKAAVNGISVWQMQEISSYTGWGSQNSMQLTFGLGNASSIDSIRVEWPSGITQYLTQITSETSLTITETAANNPAGKFYAIAPG